MSGDYYEVDGAGVEVTDGQGDGAYGYATRRDLSSWARTLFWALLALIVFGIITIFVAIPNGNIIWRSRLPRRNIREIPANEPLRAPMRIVRMVSRQPRYAPTINIIFTSPKPMASTPRNFSQVHPMSQSEPPPISAPIAAPIKDAAHSGKPAKAPCIKGPRSSKWG